MPANTNHFAYPALVEEDEGMFVISFRDVEEAITQSQTRDEIVADAVSALEEVARLYMREGKAFPLASEAREGEVLIELPISFAAKIALHNTMVANKVRQADLARALDVPTSEVARIVNPNSRVKIDTIATAVRAAGGSVSLAFAM